MRYRLFLALALFAIVAVLGFQQWASSSEKAPGPEQLGAEEATSAGAAPQPESPERGDETVAPPAADPELEAKRARYEELRQRLTRAREAREEAEKNPGRQAPSGDGDSVLPPLPRAGLQKEYIQEQMQEVVPMVKECYEMALVEDPAMGGKIVIEFVISGEEDIGGLVESSQVIAEQSNVESPPFLECMQETMYALEFEAPEGGGSTTVRYPFQFKSESGD